MHGNHVPCSCGGNEVSNEFCRDWLACSGNAILASIPVMRHDDMDASREGPLECIKNDEELHEFFIHIVSASLDDENIASTDRFRWTSIQFSVRKF